VINTKLEAKYSVYFSLPSTSRFPETKCVNKRRPEGDLKRAGTESRAPLTLVWNYHWLLLSMLCAPSFSLAATNQPRTPPLNFWMDRELGGL
jgi:hypothetical protein